MSEPVRTRPSAVYTITLRGMRFRAHVGILPEEREHSQPIEVDVTAEVAPGDTIVDYRGVYECAAAVLSSGHIDYLEEVGDRIIHATLARADRIRRVRVAIRKPGVLLPGPLEYAEVVVERDA